MPIDETLRTEAAALASRLEAHRDQVEFEFLAGPSGSRESTDPLVEIVEERGQTVFSSPALANDRTLIDLLSTAAPTASPMWFTVQLPANEGLSRVLAFYVIVPPEIETAADREEAAVGAWVLVARPLVSIDRTLGQLASVLASAVGAATLLALVTGLVVARRGTQPVRVLADSVGRVTPGDAELSLDHAQVPTELQPIVSTTERLLERVRGELGRQRQLTADVAHDLRTPVAGVRTLLDVCLQRERSREEYVAAMDKARAALRQLSQLLDDALTLSRLDADVDRPVLASVSLEKIFDVAIATVQPIAAARQVSIETEACPRTELCTDRGKLTKILSNLLGNAIEHSPAAHSVQIAARIDDGMLELSVADRGPGVPAEMRVRIFDRFVRADDARTSGDGHHGLGLPIAAGLARLLDGEITLDERHEPGSRFVVRLPLE